MKKLFYDIEITGHHSEYIGHLVDYLFKKKQNEDLYYFVVHPEFDRFFPDIATKARLIKNVTWRQIKPKEYNRSKRFGMALSSFLQYQIANRYALEMKVDHVVLLDFHTLKYSGMLFRPNYSISSILFLTFHRLKRESKRQNFEYYKRYLITKYSQKNPRLKSIYILNDQYIVGLMNKEYKTNKFKMLPDPIPNLEALSSFDIFNHYGITKNRKIFLHIGSLGHRKGTLEVLGSVKHINADYQKDITILLVGKASIPSDEQLFVNKIAEINSTTEVQVIWDNNFVPNSKMKSIFDNSDAVLLPYKNAEFSSGILGHAAVSKKTVIATGQGLIKELVLKYNLGILLDEPNEINIAKKITELLHTKNQFIGSNDFVREHSPEIFAKILLSN